MLLEKSSYINFDKIVLDIFAGNFSEYDFKELSGYENLYRIRVGNYRIIFKKENDEITILMIGTRGDVYKKLKQMFS